MISDFSISDDEFLQIVDENENYETEIFFENYHQTEKFFEDWYNSMKLFSVFLSFHNLIFNKKLIYEYANEIFYNKPFLKKK